MGTIREIKFRPTAVVFDMDGVLANFCAGISFLFNKPLSWEPGLYDFYEEIGMTYALVFKRIEAAAPAFWERLPVEDLAVSLFEALWSLGFPVKIKSQLPAIGTDKAFVGKRHFIFNTLGEARVKHFMPNADLTLLSGPGRILIDDNIEAIREWEAAGGVGVYVKHKYTPRGLKSQAMTWGEIHRYFKPVLEGDV